MCPALFLSRLSVPTHTRSMAAAKDNRTDGWLSPPRFHFTVTLTDILRKLVTRTRGRSPGCGQSPQKRSPKVKTKRQPVDKVDKEDERRRNAISASGRMGDSTKHNHAGIDCNQVYSHPDDELCDGRELAAAVAFFLGKVLGRA